MKSYSVVKENAIRFSKERKQDIRIIKANRLNKYAILFEGAQLTKNYSVIEIVKYEKEIEA